MSPKNQTLTSWLAVGALIFWTISSCCCPFGTSCCNKNQGAVSAEESPQKSCCSKTASESNESQLLIVGSPETKNSSSKICSCSKRAKLATSFNIFDLALPEISMELPEESRPEVIKWKAPAQNSCRSCPTPPSRAPPHATVI